MLKKPMLAKDGDPATIAYPCAAQAKLDGIRAMVQRDDDGKIVVVSRTLKLIPNGEVQAALARPEYVGLDGELIVGEPTAEDAYRRTTSFVMAPGKTGEPWSFHVFDKFDSSEPFSVREHEARLALLNADGCGRDVTHLRMVSSVRLDDAGALDAYEAALLAEGHEGVIVRTLNAPYKHGRSGKTGPLLKVKRFIDFEAEVVGVYERMHNANEAFRNELGRTARSTAKDGLVGRGDLGGLILRAVNGPAEGIEFRCGTGFNDAMRAALWVEHHAPMDGGLTGRVAKIKSFPLGGKEKPRFPVFLGWRDLSVDG